MLVEFECPQCAGHVCEVWSPKGTTPGIRIVYWHWLFNPAVALVELLMGQRIPERTFVCKSCPVPLTRRCYEYCPHCFTFHRSDIWSGKNAMGNWLGYFCPNCGDSIPCLWNNTSRLILALTAPLWWIPLNAFRRNWIRAERRRTAIAAASQDCESVDYGSVGNWFGMASNLLCSVYMLSPLCSILDFWIMAYLMIWTMTLGLFIWLPAGWFFTLCMRAVLDRKGDPSLYLTVRDLAGIDPVPGLGLIHSRDPIAELCEAEPPRSRAC
jgi:hypothetical protein